MPARDDRFIGLLWHRSGSDKFHSWLDHNLFSLKCFMDMFMKSKKLVCVSVRDAKGRMKLFVRGRRSDTYVLDNALSSIFFL